MQHSTMQLQFATLWTSWCDEFMQQSTMRLQFATLWNAGRQSLPYVPAVKCTNTLMTEAAAMLQHAAVTTAASDALSVGWCCKKGRLQELLAALTHNITGNGSRCCYYRQHI